MDNYVKLRLLGQGSYGRVFLAWEKHPPRRLMCVKQFLPTVPTAVSRNEIQLMKGVHHPNVVRFLDEFTTNKSQRCVVMEFYSGGDLRAFLRQKPKPVIHEDRVWHWLVQLCLALHHLHEGSPSCQIWHRDVKTSNIFLSNTGFLVLGDLGVARESSPDLASTIVGTPLYMAPEVWDGKPYDGACDLWALGCTLFEICSGRTPFEDTSSMQALIKRVCEGKYQPLSSTHWSQDLRRLIDELLAVDPTKRPSAISILRRNETRVHLLRYVEDRERVEKLHSQRIVDLSIVKKQLSVIGVPVKTSLEPEAKGNAATPARLDPSSLRKVSTPRHQQIEMEQRLRALRERERHEQLHTAIQRVKELKAKHQAEQLVQEDFEIEVNDKCPHADRIVIDSGEGEWKAPVHPDCRRPRVGSSGSRQRGILGRTKQIEFSGIPRCGVPVTIEAKSFAAKTQSPLCRDVRALRKQESKKAANLYRASLNERFNRVRRLKRSAIGVVQGNEADDVTVCIERLEEALRAQLKI